MPCPPHREKYRADLATMEAILGAERNEKDPLPARREILPLITNLLFYCTME